MDLNKSREFFNPQKVKSTCHIIGCGSIGSNVAELLARYGIKHLTLWDFDKVESHNIANQLFTPADIGRPKTEALTDMLKAINPEIEIKVNGKWENDRLGGNVFICVDSIEVRKDIIEANKNNESINIVIDHRTTLTDAQNFIAVWNDLKQRENLLNTMKFTHEEVQAETPVSACGFELSVSPVVKTAAINGICAFTNYINGLAVPQIILAKPYDFSTFVC